MTHGTARFFVGQLIEHKLFDYRGVIVGVDPTFALTDEWYKEVAQSRPPRDAPWYHVLVHGAEHVTYVAEGNLDAASGGEPIEHPLINEMLGPFAGDRYTGKDQVH